MNEARQITSNSCECTAGLGLQCKHRAALVYFINNYTDKSKTSEPCTWLAPKIANAGKEKYAEIKKIEDLIPPKKLKYEIEPLSLSKINFPCSLYNLVKSANRTESQRFVNSLINEILGKVVVSLQSTQCNQIIDVVFENQKKFKIYTNNLNFNIIYEQIFYENNVCVNKNDMINICDTTMEQSGSDTWFIERSIRISATRSHSVKTRRKDFKELAQKMLQKKDLTGQALRNVHYGLRNEPVARKAFERLTSVAVYDCGLILHYKQPWLCCSLDGICVENGKLVRTLEIKSPITCANKPIVEIENGCIKSINVSYIIFTEEEACLQLKKSHEYYTQIQIGLYCTGFNVCDMYIFSKNNESLHLTVKRDEEFLKKTILKLEMFYFKYYIKHLIPFYGL